MRVHCVRAERFDDPRLRGSIDEVAACAANGNLTGDGVWTSPPTAEHARFRPAPDTIALKPIARELATMAAQYQSYQPS
jgi:hypothetical protein